MRYEEVSKEITTQAFDFFFWFSRFEFALKENQYLLRREVGAHAEPGWDEFVEKWKGHYKPSPEAEYLLAEPPERQVVVEFGGLDWKPVGTQDCKSELAKVVRHLKTVRNNLFHGGKHGGAGWDNPARTFRLLAAGKSVLNELAAMADFQADYTQYY